VKSEISQVINILYKRNQTPRNYTMSINRHVFAKPIATLTSDQLTQYKQAVAEATSIVEQSSIDTDPAWEFVSESTQQATKLEKLSTAQVPTYRVTGELYNTTIEDVFNLLWDLENAIKLSGSLEECDLLNETENIQLIYHGHKSPGFMISQRDFLLARTNTTAGISKLIVTKSVTHSSVPDRSKHVRGHLHYSGYVLKPSPTKEHTVKVTYVIQSDPKGSLPTWVVNMANKTLIEKFVELQNHLPKRS
jgi:hypothetical protein